MKKLLMTAALALAGCEERPRQTEPAPQAETRPRRVLQSSLAGSWYEGDPVKLRDQLKEMIGKVPDKPIEGICALILPHAGYRFSGPTAAYGARQLLGRSFDRVIVIGPTHHLDMENAAHVPASFTHFATPLGEVPLDTEFIDALRKHPCFTTLPGMDEQEHSVQIEVPFLQAALGAFRLVPIVVGRLDAATARSMARIIAGRIDGRTLVVASSDFTHYGPNYDYIPFEKDVEENLRKLDLGAFEAMKGGKAGDFYAYVTEHRATICGRQSIRLLLEMLPPKAELRLLKYDTSGRITGDFANSVSYLSIAVIGAWPRGTPVEPAPGGKLSEKDRRLLLEIARKALQRHYEKGGAFKAEDLGIEITDAMRRTQSAFVTLTKRGDLRGCIGGIYPTQPLCREVKERALDAALNDSRFDPVAAEELPGLHIEISAMTPPAPVASYKDIIIGRHGMILEKEGRRAVFLPQVAPEQKWDLPTTLRHLSRKAGLPEDAWKEGASFQVFEAEVFGE